MTQQRILKIYGRSTLIVGLFLAAVVLAPGQGVAQYIATSTVSSTSTAHYDGRVGFGTGTATLGSSPFLAPLTLHQSTTTEGRLLTFYRNSDTTKRWSVGMSSGVPNAWYLAWEAGSAAPSARFQVNEYGGASFEGTPDVRDMLTLRAHDSNSPYVYDTGQWAFGVNQDELYLYNNVTSPLVFPLKVLKANGYVGIGIDPLAALHVKGDLRFGAGGTNTDLVITTETTVPQSFNNVTYNQVNSIIPVTLPAANTTTHTALHLKTLAGSSNNFNTMDLVVDGNIAAKYQDVAEWVPSVGSLSAGTLVSIDSASSNTVRPSQQAYDTAVAGVVSALPGVILGEGGPGKSLIATTGRVHVRADATNHPIARGDLLVASTKAGYAMASVPVDIGGAKVHRPGTVIGKALEPLPSGEGEILVLLTLQ